MPEEKQEFVVRDRRRFTEGSPESQEDKPPPKDESDSRETPKDKAKLQESARRKDSKTEFQLPKIDFPTFIFSLNSSVYVQLGLLEDPATGERMKNLPLAKQTIDILGMLEEKTRGNLTKEEEHMLRSILYDLRILYVKEKG
jgi:hypothetical protein